MYDTSECIQETPSVQEADEQNESDSAETRRQKRRKRKGALDQLYVVPFTHLLFQNHDLTLRKFLINSSDGVKNYRKKCYMLFWFHCRVEEGIEMQVRNKQSVQTPPAGCSSRTSYTEPMAGSDDSIHSSAGFAALSTASKEPGFKAGGSTIGRYLFICLLIYFMIGSVLILKCYYCVIISDLKVDVHRKNSSESSEEIANSLGRMLTCFLEKGFLIV